MDTDSMSPSSYAIEEVRNPPRAIIHDNHKPIRSRIQEWVSLDTVLDEEKPGDTRHRSSSVSVDRAFLRK